MVKVGRTLNDYYDEALKEGKSPEVIIENIVDNFPVHVKAGIPYQRRDMALPARALKTFNATRQAYTASEGEYGRYYDEDADDDRTQEVDAVGAKSTAADEDEADENEKPFFARIKKRGSPALNKTLQDNDGKDSDTPDTEHLSDSEDEDYTKYVFKKPMPVLKDPRRLVNAPSKAQVRPLMPGRRRGVHRAGGSLTVGTARAKLLPPPPTDMADYVAVGVGGEKSKPVREKPKTLGGNHKPLGEKPKKPLQEDHGASARATPVARAATVCLTASPPRIIPRNADNADDKDDGDDSDDPIFLTPPDSSPVGQQQRSGCAPALTPGRAMQDDTETKMRELCLRLTRLERASKTANVHLSEMFILLHSLTETATGTRDAVKLLSGPAAEIAMKAMSVFPIQNTAGIVTYMEEDPDLKLLTSR